MILQEKEELAIDWVENLPQASLTTFDRPKVRNSRVHTMSYLILWTLLLPID